MRRLRFGMIVLAAIAAIAGCTGNGDDGGGTANQAPAQAAAEDRLQLKGVCPDTITIQSDWFAESEYGVYYHLIGPNPTIDTNKKVVSGPLVAEGKDTGVRIEVRSGGPATGFEPVTSQMYKDKDIMLGQVSTDEAIRFSAQQPTIAVMAPMEKSPFMIMWDPKAHPQFNILVDIGQTDTKVLYFEADTYMQYLIGSGILRQSQVDGSYDGAPAKFVSSRGAIAQAGFATSEPYIYEHELPEWNKPVKYALISDTGYDFYPQALSIRAGDKAALAPCLKKLVPIIQRAQVDFLAKPDKTNALIVDVVKKNKADWNYSLGLANYSVSKMRSDFVNNGPDQTLGNFDPAKVQRIVDIVTPILNSQRAPAKPGLKADDLFTNEFIDPSIGVAQ